MSTSVTFVSTYLHSSRWFPSALRAAISSTIACSSDILTLMELMQHDAQVSLFLLGEAVRSIQGRQLHVRLMMSCALRNYVCYS